ncbi:lactate dehydrogenase-like 2-hydroxyacid dehydrogenase [Amycolatopsis sulphurea]|uniref:Lactate dehydrogenase-like 2-hydroxyacid dehydrogenase n=1 Tax=Amycolatopsis sulphurea TaxID=76022 RepID=A0A2A9FHS4_9PSEU|nr:D-glycerate dehydrogenase [Amycolatopsis sulphurea]PFG51017.1 lactate dehydrogenase-like 2-hydroxyacid dehydrogenase [Amycolatopsis sulphurea]
MGKRVLSTRGTLPGAGLDRLAGYVDLVRGPTDEKPTPAQLHALATGAAGILCLGNDVVDAALLDAAGPQLQVVSLASAGFDAVDQTAAAERGVVVTHTPGVLAETTADLAWSLILMARRRLGTARDRLHAGTWTTFRMDDHLGLDVHGTTLGLVGYGQIGRAVARRATGFGVRVLCHDPYSAPADGLAEPVGFESLLAQSDIVSLHVPLTDTTRHLIGTKELHAMKPTATLVNTSRGGVVDEAALLTALRDGTLHSAGLDVFAQEPRGEDVADLIAASRLVALPHVGSATEATRAAMVDLAVANLLAVLAGEPARTPLPG